MTALCSKILKSMDRIVLIPSFEIVAPKAKKLRSVVHSIR